MTGLLKDLMTDKAEHAGSPRLDFDAIVEAGDRRVRRRRLVTGAGVAAVAAAVVAAFAVVPAVVDKADPDPVHQPAAPDFSANEPTYALGSQIHYGAQTIDVAPLAVTALARTDSGFVFTAADKSVYFTDGDAPLRLKGTVRPSQAPVLVASGPYAAWVDDSSNTQELVVYNTAKKSEDLRLSGPALSGNPRDPFERTSVLAMDGSQLYWHNLDGIVVTDMSALDAEPIVLKPHASTEWLYDAVKGVFARASFDDLTVTVSRDTEAEGPNFTGDFGALSADASYVATSNGAELLVFNVRNGRPVTSERLAFGYARLLEWLNDDTYVVVAEALGGNPKADVLECSAHTKQCLAVQADVDNLDAVVGSSGF